MDPHEISETELTGQSRSAQEKTPLLVMRAVSKRFGATIALDGVDLEVCAGEVVALMGENGAGKSTLMKVLSGAHQPDSGSMMFDGKSYSPKDPLQARLQGLAMIYQELSLAPDLTVTENILLGMEAGRGGILNLKAMRQTAADAMRQVGRPDIPLDVPVSRFSIAQQQLVEIARAVAIGCKVLVLDEPTSSLALRDIQNLFALVNRLKAQGHAIVYISHFLEEVKEICDRFVVLRDGKSVGGGTVADATHGQIISLMVGRSVSELYPRSVRTPGETVLNLDSVAARTVPSCASLQLRRGEILGIAGLVGAGRTEMLRTIFGLDAVVSGSVTITSSSRSISANQSSGKQKQLSKANPHDRWSQGVGMVSEDRKNEGLALNLSISDNIVLPVLTPFINPERLDTKTTVWCDKLAMKRQSVQQTVASLSGGNQQKVALARLLMHDSDVLLLDEPTRGIDVGAKAEIYRAIDQLAQQQKAILIVSSYLPELLGVCDRIAVMCRGVLGEAHLVADVDEQILIKEAIGEREDFGALN